MPKPRARSSQSHYDSDTDTVLALADVVAVLSETAPGHLPSEWLRWETSESPPPDPPARRRLVPPLAAPVLLPQPVPPALPAPEPDLPTAPLRPPAPRLGQRDDLGELMLPTPSSNLRRIETLSQELWELRLVSLSDGDYHGQQLHRLRRSLCWLLVGSVAAIATSLTALAWTNWRLQVAQSALTRYGAALHSQQRQLEQLEREQLAPLEAELLSLQAELPDALGRKLTANEQGVAQLQRDMQNLEANLADQSAAIAALLDAMQDQPRRRDRR